MLLFKQLELLFSRPRATSLTGRDAELEVQARELLRGSGAATIAATVRVEWNSRMRSAAGRADFRHQIVTLNPRLRAHGPEEIDRTLRHELAHLLAQFRAGRRRISPHGDEWRQACADLGIAGEARCHDLQFPISRRQRRLVYRCPACQKSFPRVRRMKRASACLACCRAHNRGQYDGRFRLRLVDNSAAP